MLQGSAFFQNPYPAYAELRAHGAPVFDEKSGAWMVGRFADVESVLRDPRISKKIQREEATVFETSVLFRDPPDHGRIRGALNQAFAQMPVDIEDRVARIADELIDRMLLKGRVDFMQDFALPLPVAVIAEVLGVPAADTGRLHAWSSEFILDDSVRQSDRDQRQFAAICGMEDYFRNLIAGGNVDGMIGVLMQSEGDKLTSDELIGNCILLMVAGHETTVNLLGNGLHLLLEEPERFARLKQEPKMLPTAIDEMLRFESPVQLGTFRVTAEPVDIGGVTIPAGAMISAIIGAANRDPDIFPNPDVFDLARTPNRHLSFGFGPHRCIGAQLARAEARVGFECLLERLPNLRLETIPPTWMGSLLRRIGMGEPEAPRAPQWRQTMVTRGLRELPVNF